MWVHGADIVWRYFDIGASFIWAVSGALLAARRGYDLTGICAVALVSSTGGGLLRDGIFLQQGPPAMLLTPIYIGAAGLAGLIVWGLGSKARILSVLHRCAGVVDAIGLGAFAVVGMQLALRVGIPVPGVVLVGVVNAVGGSVLRSLLLFDVPEVFRPGELTALASLLGCLVHVTPDRRPSRRAEGGRGDHDRRRRAASWWLGALRISDARRAWLRGGRGRAARPVTRNVTGRARQSAWAASDAEIALARRLIHQRA